MIDRRTKNADIFRDTERRYTSDPTLIKAVQKSTEAQVFISERGVVIVPSPHKAEKAKVIVSGSVHSKQPSYMPSRARMYAY